ncbi:hypothetical protein [Nocardioides sp. R-C-SC26]|uniref:hypothetical protein n=1 Tax=Nocardioides sp. R-C-SC26 TaxID=2870414 RepID=UPI001E32F8F6|nr:hypothetical protein [Nocardioides sp. R-C-SC26]
MPRIPFNLEPLRRLLSEPPTYLEAGAQIRAGAAVFWRDYVTRRFADLNEDLRLGPLSGVVAGRMARESVDAYLQIEMANALSIGVPQHALTEAMGLSSAGNFHRQFPDVARIAKEMRELENSGREATFEINGVAFRWYFPDWTEPE